MGPGRLIGGANGGARSGRPETDDGCSGFGGAGGRERVRSGGGGRWAGRRVG
ncbi:MAG: hypothetical protein OZSIB_0873 [Candidatus Ozemobacter sibiricus]|uniref:Uncharacterized protein n=1 Tax=Candidatus Ozemobacter sibiricus TaxID=2268124 RepID=A0A367ZVJ8_9BACT|nr:MAG: hypothetical protein OZSIB_0873 [Candidatus Ozemobacter sibiricus]